MDLALYTTTMRFALCLAWTTIASASLVLPTHRSVPQAAGLRMPARAASTRAAVPLIMQVSDLATGTEFKRTRPHADPAYFSF